MKKILFVLTCVFTLLGLAACEKKTADEPSLEGVTLIARMQVQRIGSSCIAYMLYDDESGKAFVFPLYIAESAEDVELGKTYTFPEDMNTVYAYWMLSD